MSTVNPVFSILVPTVNRPETLVHCLRTVLEQSGADHEVIVSDDQGPPENKQVVESFNRPDVLRYVRTPQRLGMRGNYEFCVTASRGRYLTVLGDDDGFCVGALDAARQVIAQGNPEVFFWFPHLYWWPNALIPQKQWMLYIYANPNQAQWVDPRAYLTQFYGANENPWLFERLPSIYNGFVSRTLLERQKARTGAYFRDEIPDVYSGIANALLAQNAMFMARALTIRGLSGKSFGVAFRSREGRALYEDWKKHMATPMCEPELIDSTALAVHIASIKLRAIRTFSELGSFQITPRQVIAGIATELNEDDARYDELVRDMHALAVKHGIDPSTLQVPPRAPIPRTKRWGVTVDTPGKAVLAINGEPLNIADIYAASQCVRAVLG
jgi:hypothetical protein